MHSMSRSLRYSVVGFFLGGLFSAATVQAAPLSPDDGHVFRYVSECVSNCSVVGLAVGDPVKGLATFERSSIRPSSIVNEDSLLSLSFTFGEISFQQKNGVGPTDVIFGGLLDETGYSFAEFDMFLYDTILPELGPFASVEGPPEISFLNYVSLNGGCRVEPGISCRGGFPASYFASAELTLVPLPASLPLLASLLVSIGIGSRFHFRRSNTPSLLRANTRRS